MSPPSSSPPLSSSISSLGEEGQTKKKLYYYLQISAQESSLASSSSKQAKASFKVNIKENKQKSTIFIHREKKLPIIPVLRKRINQDYPAFMADPNNLSIMKHYNDVEKFKQKPII